MVLRACQESACLVMFLANGCALVRWLNTQSRMFGLPVVIALHHPVAVVSSRKQLFDNSSI